MSGIAGIEAGGKTEIVERMLSKIDYRGNGETVVIAERGITIGTNLSNIGRREQKLTHYQEEVPTLKSLAGERMPFAAAGVVNNKLVLSRDRVGVRPLYYGYTNEGEFVYASEVKALMEATDDIHEFLPGHLYESGKGFVKFATIKEKPVKQLSAEDAATGLHAKLLSAVLARINSNVMGSWLSGGIDSSVIVALVRPLVKTLHTFAAGLPGAPDVEFARIVADHVKTTHHEVVISEKELPKVLGEVIFALESFDALLVRSTIMNYLVSQVAKNYVDSVFSGEGGDELFAGYEYIQELPASSIPAELVDITNRLHNTALQRVDRSSRVNGLVAHVPFVDGDVLDYALTIPAEFKLKPGNPPIEKWILRKALENDLPESVLWRKKAKFWEGSGVGDMLSKYAEGKISDSDFKSQRMIRKDWKLNTKEELLYYRFFNEHFGQLEDLSWMGRTKGAPIE